MSFWQWFLEVMIGPVCPHGCGYRARGDRTLAKHKIARHNEYDHAGDSL